MFDKKLKLECCQMTTVEGSWQCPTETEPVSEEEIQATCKRWRSVVWRAVRSVRDRMSSLMSVSGQSQWQVHVSAAVFSPCICELIPAVFDLCSGVNDCYLWVWVHAIAL